MRKTNNTAREVDLIFSAFQRFYNKTSDSKWSQKQEWVSSWTDILSLEKPFSYFPIWIEQSALWRKKPSKNALRFPISKYSVAAMRHVSRYWTFVILFIVELTHSRGFILDMFTHDKIERKYWFDLIWAEDRVFWAVVYRPLWPD